MISLEVQQQDLANLRFAFSPLVELSMSYKQYRNGELGIFGQWVDEVNRALHGVELPYMDAVILPRHYVADFITPTPNSNEFDIEQAFAQMRFTPVEVIRKNVAYLMIVDGETPARRHFQTFPYEALDCLIEEMRFYWSVALARHWPRMVSVLESDILFRARDLAIEGIETLFRNLSPVVSYRDAQIQLHKQYLSCNYESGKTVQFDDFNVSLEGRGLQLVPVLLGCNSLSWQVQPEWAPMIVYPARGAGLWYSAAQPDPEQSLQRLLGAGRARLLVALQTPSHTTELAQRLSVTSGAVSQLLARLGEAGLVDSHRSSHKVYYRLTNRGQQLLALFAEESPAAPSLVPLSKVAS
jgi:DNA-binding MarR family transcriptional regulator